MTRSGSNTAKPLGTWGGVPSRRRLPMRRAGFTLIEVLVTMLLLGIILPVTMRGISLALAASTHAQRMTLASSLADEKLNDLITQGITNTGTGAGDFSPDHPDYHWKSDIQTRDYGLDEVDLTVTWTERGQERSLVLSTLVYDGSNSSNSTGVQP